MEDPFTIRKASSHVKVACRRSCWSCREFGLVELKILKNKEEKEKINKNNIFFYFFNSSCDLWWLINSSEHVLIWSVFGWLKASRLACFSSHRITVSPVRQLQLFGLCVMKRTRTEVDWNIIRWWQCSILMGQLIVVQKIKSRASLSRKKWYNFFYETKNIQFKKRAWNEWMENELYREYII